MKSNRLGAGVLALSVLFTGALAQAATVTGTVTNKTTGKPAVGDTVELVDVQAGMRATAHATTDGSGHYSLSEPGSGPYLIRAIHQGAGYFIAAPQGSGPGNLTVYDSAAKVVGVSTEDDILQIESQNGQLNVAEQYVVRNISSPPITQFSTNNFEFVLPTGAVLDGAEATRPSGLPTNAIPLPLGQKGHYSFNVPIQPDEGENPTVFVVHYHLTYSGSYSFDHRVVTPVTNFAVQLPKAMTFTAGAGLNFQAVPENPAVQTLLLKNPVPGKALQFSVSGTGSLPREDQGAAAGQQGGGAMGAQDNGNGGPEAAPGNQPGGGIGTPINTPDPLSKYKWWILGGLGLLLIVAAAFLLRKPAGPPLVAGATAVGVASTAGVSTASKHTLLLNALKEELFALESEKIDGSISAEEYAKVKAALETVLRRALKRA
ncbi:MAG: carboxypeptidase-like regulatory domain-containing protein [Terracidiphilus sp.]|jgi:hypothetical protein